MRPARHPGAATQPMHAPMDRARGLVRSVDASRRALPSRRGVVAGIALDARSDSA